MVKREAFGEGSEVKRSLEACKRNCLNEIDCEGIATSTKDFCKGCVRLPASSSSLTFCARLSQINPVLCDKATKYDLHLRPALADRPPLPPLPPGNPPPLPPLSPAPPVPPSPPSAPPSPPTVPYCGETPPSSGGASAHLIRQISPDTRQGAVLDAINRRFKSGQPSDHLSGAGVFVHILDQLDDGDGGQPWRACQTGWCQGFDRFSCSIVNQKRGATYGGSKGLGFVLSPSTYFVCSYTKDGGTQVGAAMGGCCTLPACSLANVWPEGGCQWPRAMLHDALTAQMYNTGPMDHNEYIVPADFWDANLPHIIEAVICRTDCDQARKVHRRFLAAYGLTAAQTPLLYYGGSSVGFRSLD